MLDPFAQAKAFKERFGKGEFGIFRAAEHYISVAINPQLEKFLKGRMAEINQFSEDNPGCIEEAEKVIRDVLKRRGLPNPTHDDIAKVAGAVISRGCANKAGNMPKM